jgi:hypothetical protein
VSKDGRGLCWVHIYSRLRLFLGANRYTLFAGKPSCMMNRSVVAPKVADDTCVRRCRWVRVGLLRARSGFLWCAHGAQDWPGSCLKCPQVVFVASNGKVHANSRCISLYRALEAWGQPASLGSVSGSAPEQECPGARMGIVWCCLVVAHPGPGMHSKC